MKKTALILCVSALFSGFVLSADTSFAQGTQTYKDSVIAVPAGEVFRGVFMSPISSYTAYTGQEITLALGSDFYHKGKIIAPAGSTISGVVIDVSSAKHGSLNGKLKLRFTHIITPGGFDIPISAIVKTEDNSGVILGGKNSEISNLPNSEINVKNSTIANTISSPAAAGNGSALANAVGSGGGLFKSIWEKGTEVLIPTNASVDLILIQPITATPTGEENW